jgi:hypothetical protein
MKRSSIVCIRSGNILVAIATKNCILYLEDLLFSERHIGVNRLPKRYLIPNGWIDGFIRSVLYPFYGRNQRGSRYTSQWRWNQSQKQRHSMVLFGGQAKSIQRCVQRCAMSVVILLVSLSRYFCHRRFNWHCHRRRHYRRSLRRVPPASYSA